MKPARLKHKLTLAVIALAIAALGAASAVQLTLIERDMLSVLSAQQMTLVSGLTREVDQKILDRLNALSRAASLLHAESMKAADLPRVKLAGWPGVASLFDRIALISTDGATVAMEPDLAEGRRSDLRARPWFKEVAAGRPVVSAPYRSSITRQPVIVLAVPVVDAGGKLIGVLAGVLHIFGANFLGALAETPVGKSGSLAVFSRDRMIVMSTAKDRILTPGPAPGVSPYFDRATAGLAGTEENTNSRGLRALFTYKPLHAVPWVMVASLPVDEAYAPIRRAQRNTLALAAALLAVIALLSWFLVDRMLRPLLALHAAVRQNRQQPDQPIAAAVSAGDEVGELAAEFNAFVRERSALDLDRQAAQAQIESSLREKDVLLREIHHRVKNNMQVVSSLLQLQSGYIESSEAREVFSESQGRIKSMALVHEKLYQAHDFAEVDFADYAHSLVSMLAAAHGDRRESIVIDVRAQPVRLDIDHAVPAGLILNELVSNCFKHAFPGGRPGRIEVELGPHDAAMVRMAVRDDGVGPPAGFDAAASLTLGLRLVRILAEQLGATMTLGRESGFACELVFGSQGTAA